MDISDRRSCSCFLICEYCPIQKSITRVLGILQPWRSMFECCLHCLLVEKEQMYKSEPPVRGRCNRNVNILRTTCLSQALCPTVLKIGWMRPSPGNRSHVPLVGVVPSGTAAEDRAGRAVWSLCCAVIDGSVRLWREFCFVCLRIGYIKYFLPPQISSLQSEVVSPPKI